MLLSPQWIPSSQVSGLAKGSLTEMVSPLGGGKTSMVLQVLAENPQFQVAWVEHDFTIYPPCFVQRGIPLQNILFVEARSNFLWAILQILRSQLFDLVVASHPRWTTVELRRLQLAAEKAHAAVFLLQESPIQEGRWALGRKVQVINRRAA